eukprot:4021251-Lingulodinium_polyedra.AAC.1
MCGASSTGPDFSEQLDGLHLPRCRSGFGASAKTRSGPSMSVAQCALLRARPTQLMLPGSSLTL